METSNNKAIHNGKNDKPSFWKNIPLTIKISTGIAIVTAYSHFFGYSFLKGKLEAMGFHGANVNPHINETLFLASEGLVQGVYSVFADYLFSTKMLVISMLTCIFFAAVAAATLYGFKLKQWSSREVQSSKRDDSNKAKAIVVALVGVLGFALQFIFALVVLIVLATMWTVISMGQQLGKGNIKYLIDSGVCTTKKWEKVEGSYVVGCIEIQDNGQKVHGRFIYEAPDKTYFLSNDAAYLLDESGSIIYKANIHVRPVR